MNIVTGNKGKLVFKAPFDKYNTDIEWTVSGDNTIQHFNMLGVDLFKLVYEKEEMSQNDYDNDLLNNVKIITLINEAQEILNIPSNKIDLSGSQASYRYRENVLMIPLPSFPEDYSFSGLIDDIKVLVKERIAFDVNVETVPTSAITLVTEDNHTLFMNRLNSGITNRKNYKTRYLEVVQLLNEKNTLIAEMTALAVRELNNI